MVVLCSSGACSRYSPEDNVRAKLFCNGDLLEHKGIRDLCDQVGDKESCGSVGEIIAFQLQVLVQSHDGGIVEQDLVDKLHGIA